MKSFLLTGLLATAISASPVNLSSRATCATGVHMIVARGTTELQGEGLAGETANAIADKISGSDSEALVYPASFYPTYMESESEGVTAMNAAIKSYATSCPDSKIVLIGYSQGAQVVGDTLCGGSELGFNSDAAISSEYGDKVAAVLLFGDPAHVIGQSYDKGTSTRNGIDPRTNTASCDAYADRIQSYCDSDDEFCDSGTSIEVHIGYFSKYTSDAVDFVASKV